MFKKLRQKLVPIAISLLIVASMIGLQWFAVPQVKDLLERIEYIIYDQRLKAFPLKHNPDFKIVIVDVDESSIQREGRWPWTRNKIAQLVTQLSKAGAVVIAFDMVFSDLELNTREEVIQEFERNVQLTGEERKKIIELVKSHDPNQAFINSVKDIDSILGFILHNKSHNPVGFLPRSTIELNAEELPLSHLRIPQLSNYTGNLPEFSKAARSSGFISIFPDKDGVLRKAPMVLRFNNVFYSSLSLETVRLFKLLDKVGVDIAQEGRHFVVDTLDVGGRKISTDGFGQVFIPYIGPERSYPYLSAGNIIADDFDKKAIEGAIIIIGSSALGIGDLRSTPMMTGYPGVEVQANLISGLLNNNFPLQPSWAQGLTVVIIAFLGLVLAFIMPFLNAIGLISLTISLLVLLIISNLYLWISFSFVMPLAILILLLLGLGMFNLAYGYFIEDKLKRDLSDMFGQYVPAEHIAEMAENPNKHYGFEGESRDMTVLFCDIQNFTPMAQKMTANEIKQFLESYLSPMTEIIFEHHGTIDKYVGDMIMAFWNAPLEDKEHHAHAIGAALAMQEKLDELNQKWKAQSISVEIAVGINSGVMNVGDMGSEFRRSYTVIGDAVNLGARLEHITRDYKVPIIMSEATYEAQGEYAAIWLDNVKVKGREDAEHTKIYKPLGRKESLSSEDWQWVAQHDRAVEDYLARNFDAAEAVFKRLLDEHPKLYGLYEYYLKQIKGQRHF